MAWEPAWRGQPRIEDGNAREGWRHIDERHVTGNAPGGPGGLRTRHDPGGENPGPRPSRS